MSGASIVGINSGFYQQKPSTAPPFSPSGITGLVMWYSDKVNSGTDRTGLSNGAAITQWDDLSGGGYHLNEAAGTPTYNLSENGIDLNATGDLLGRSTSSPYSSSVVGTIFVAYYSIATVSWQYMIWLGDYSGNYYSPANTASRLEHENYSNGRWVLGSGLRTVKGIHTLITPSTNVSLSELRRNGVSQGTNAGSGTIGTLGNEILLGGYVDGGTNYGYDTNKNQRFYEIIGYDNELTTANILLVEDYLNTKYTLY